MKFIPSVITMYCGFLCVQIAVGDEIGQLVAKTTTNW